MEKSTPKNEASEREFTGRATLLHRNLSLLRIAENVPLYKPFGENMNVKNLILQIVLANPLISYEEIKNELLRTLEDEQQDGINDLLKEKRIVKRAKTFYKVA